MCIRDSGWRIDHHAVPYDVTAALRRFAESGYLDAAGPMARLYRCEVATAAFQIMPFLHWLRTQSGAEASMLGAAVDRFLAGR